MQLSCVTKSKKWRKEMGIMLNEEKKWYELKNVRCFYEFFEKNKKYFNGDVVK